LTKRFAVFRNPSTCEEIEMIDTKIAVDAGEARDEYIRKHAFAEADAQQLRTAIEGLMETLKVNAPAYPGGLVSGAYVIRRLHGILQGDPSGDERMVESKLTGPVSPEEAFEIVDRFINGHFSNKGKEGPRISIPADHKRDDDIRLMAFVEQAKAAFDQLAELRERLKVPASDVDREPGDAQEG
jgi:hypothetical protein